MRYASLTPQTSDTKAYKTWLIGDDSRRGPGSRFIISGWPSFAQVTQGIQYLEGQFEQYLAHGNRSVTFTIQTEHEFVDESQCFLFTARMALDCPPGGLLEVGVLGTGGGKVFYPNAVVKSVRAISGASDPTVVSMRFEYQIQAGLTAPQTGGS